MNCVKTAQVRPTKEQLLRISCVRILSCGHYGELQTAYDSIVCRSRWARLRTGLTPTQQQFCCCSPCEWNYRYCCNRLVTSRFQWIAPKLRRRIICKVYFLAKGQFGDRTRRIIRSRARKTILCQGNGAARSSEVHLAIDSIWATLFAMRSAERRVSLAGDWRNMVKLFFKYSCDAASTASILLFSFNS